jgi:dinuclear metal center YbgI/SA1388 family protein
MDQAEHLPGSWPGATGQRTCLADRLSANRDQTCVQSCDAVVNTLPERCMRRDDLVAHLDTYLQIRDIEDSSNNGLQVEGSAEVTRLAFAVDAGLAAFHDAQEARAEMLIVHHGLFWSKPVLVTGIQRQRLQVLFDANLSLYAVHLPLDFHLEVGNNATLARWLGLEEMTSFGEYKRHSAGLAGHLPDVLQLDQFVAQVERTLGEPVIQTWPFGPEMIRRVAVVSGGAGFLVGQAAEAGADVYLTGEVSHSVYHEAQELGLNVVYGGHYATETAGLKSLAEYLAAWFDLETVFLDLPTGA